jgi:DNA-binding MarR family transcriptional regulator
MNNMRPSTNRGQYEVLLNIARGNNYNNKLSIALNQSPPNILKKLKRLEKLGLIYSKIVGNNMVFPFERKVYSLNAKSRRLMEYWIEKSKFDIELSKLNEKFKDVFKIDEELK